MQAVIAGRQWLFLALLLIAGFEADAGIYSCTGAKGNRTISDHPRAGCVSQTVHGKTGEPRGEVPKFQTPEEVAAADEEQRAHAMRKAEDLKRARSDRELLRLFPDQAAHDRARAKEQADIRHNIRQYEGRIASTERERATLMAEKDFYPGGNLPLKLKLAFDGNDATLAATRNSMQTAQTDLSRSDAKFDQQLAYLKGLWGSRR